MKTIIVALSLAAAFAIGVFVGLWIPRNRYSVQTILDPTDYLPADVNRGDPGKILIKVDAASGRVWSFTKVIRTNKDGSMSTYSSWDELRDEKMKSIPPPQ